MVQGTESGLLGINPRAAHQHLKDGMLAKSVGLMLSVEMGNRDPCRSKVTRVTDDLATTGTPENSQARTRTSPYKKVARPSDQQKCMYTNTHSTGNKKEELEAIRKTNLVSTTET